MIAWRVSPPCKWHRRMQGVFFRVFFRVLFMFFSVLQCSIWVWSGLVGFVCTLYIVSCSSLSVVFHHVGHCVCEFSQERERGCQRQGWRRGDRACHCYRAQPSTGCTGASGRILHGHMGRVSSSVMNFGSVWPCLDLFRSTTLVVQPHCGCG